MRDLSLQPRVRYFTTTLCPVSRGAFRANEREPNKVSFTVPGAAETPAAILLRTAKKPRAITLPGRPVADFDFPAGDRLSPIRFANEARPRTLTIGFWFASN